MTTADTHFLQQMIRAAVGFGIVGLVFFVLIRMYWLWYVKHLRQKDFDAGSNSNKKLTLFDVREFLLRGEKEKAIKVYRQIFKTDQKTAQVAVEALERNLHQQGG